MNKKEVYETRVKSIENSVLQLIGRRNIHNNPKT